MLQIIYKRDEQKKKEELEIKSDSPEDTPHVRKIIEPLFMRKEKKKTIADKWKGALKFFQELLGQLICHCLSIRKDL
jgi:hypothetical protein